jgi:hypothetical protein
MTCLTALRELGASVLCTRRWAYRQACDMALHTHGQNAGSSSANTRLPRIQRTVVCEIYEAAPSKCMYVLMHQAPHAGWLHRRERNWHLTERKQQHAYKSHKAYTCTARQ